MVAELDVETIGFHANHCSAGKAPDWLQKFAQGHPGPIAEINNATLKLNLP